MNGLLAFHPARPFELLGAGGALNEQQVAGEVLAVRVIVARGAALVAAGHHVVRNALRHPFVKNKVLADVQIVEPLLADLSGVLDDAAVQLMDVGEAAVLEPRGGFFAPNSTGAVHDDVAVVLAFQHVFHLLNLLAERVHIGQNRTLEVAHLALVMVAHVDQNRVLALDQLVELWGVQVHATIAHIERLVVEPVGHDLRAHLDDELEERLAFVDREVEADAFKEVDAVEVGAKRIELFRRNGNLSVNALVGDIGSAEDVHGLPVEEQVVAEELRILNAGVLVERNRRSFTLFVAHALNQHLPIDQVAQFVLHAISGHRPPARRVVREN